MWQNSTTTNKQTKTATSAHLRGFLCACRLQARQWRGRETAGGESVKLVCNALATGSRCYYSYCLELSLTVFGLEFAHSSAASSPGSIISLRNRITRGHSLNMVTLCWFCRRKKSPTSSSGTSLNGAVIEAPRCCLDGEQEGRESREDVARDGEDEDAVPACFQTDRLTAAAAAGGARRSRRSRRRHRQGGRQARSTSAWGFSK